MEQNENIDDLTKKEKPTIDRTPQYRYPKGFVKDGKRVGGRIMSKSDAEKLDQEGKLSTMTVASSGAVTNEQLQHYKQKLNKYEYEQFGSKFAKSFEKSNDGIKREEFIKLFETMSNKISSTLGTINTNVVDIKKENGSSSTKLINLTTSILAASSSQRDTLNELYKIVDSKLSDLVSKRSDKNVPKTKLSEDREPKVAGIIRGIGGLNKQLVAINGNMAKMVKLLNSLAEKSGISTKITPTITPEEKKEKIDEPQKLEKVSSVKSEKAGPLSESRSSTFLEGIAKIAGGATLMTLAASINEMVKSVKDLKEYINIPEKAKALHERAVDDVSYTFSAMDSGQFFEQGKEVLTDQLNTILDFAGKITGLTDDFKEFSSYIDKIGNGIAGFAKDVKDIFPSFGNDSKEAENVKSQPKTFAEKAITSDTKSQIKPENTKIEPKDVNGKKVESEKVVSTKQHKILNPPIVTKHRLDLYEKSPVGEFSVSNPAPKASSISDYMVSQPLSNSTEAVAASSKTVEDIKMEKTGQQNGSTQGPVVINNNNVNNNQTNGTGFIPSVRNTDSTKSFLDRMSISGQYIGTGFTLK